MAHVDSRILLCKKSIKALKSKRNRVSFALKLFDEGIPGHKDLSSVLIQIDEDMEHSNQALNDLREIKGR